MFCWNFQHFKSYRKNEFSKNHQMLNPDQGAQRTRHINSDGDEVESGSEDEDGKRKITYKMEKNKGFIPKRQKKRRNPRVKHRGQFLLWIT